MKRKTLITIGIALMLVLAGCSTNQSDQQSKELEDSTGQNFDNVSVGSSYLYEVRATEKNQMGLVQAQPPFQMDSSLERSNLIDRYKYLNDQNNVHHVYLMSNDGKVVAYFVAQGKVSSVNSKLTNDKQIVQAPQFAEGHDNWEETYFKVESPQMDGSYGSNGDAIFFFTTSGDYVEWNGKYLVSEKPLNIQTSVSLEQDVGEDSNESSNSTATNSTDG